MAASSPDLEALYAQLGSALLAYFRQHPLLADAAEDLLQDTFLRAFRSWGRVRESVSPRAYLFGIARHVRQDALRRHHAVVELEIDPPAAPAAVEDERLEPLRAAIVGLPGPQREALLLKLQHELSYLEIAEVLGIPIGTVRSRLHLAVIHLKARLNPTAAEGRLEP